MSAPARPEHQDGGPGPEFPFHPNGEKEKILSQSWFSKSKEGKMSAIDRRSRPSCAEIRPRDAVRSANVTKAVFQNSSIV